MKSIVRATETTAAAASTMQTSMSELAEIMKFQAAGTAMLVTAMSGALNSTARGGGGYGGEMSLQHRPHLPIHSLGDVGTSNTPIGLPSVGWSSSPSSCALLDSQDQSACIGIAHQTAVDAVGAGATEREATILAEVAAVSAAAATAVSKSKSSDPQRNPQGGVPASETKGRVVGQENGRDLIERTTLTTTHEKNLTDASRIMRKKNWQNIRANERCGRLMTDIETLEGESGYPAGLPAFKSSLADAELESELADAVNNDCTWPVVFPKGCKRRNTLEVIHRTAALLMRKVQHESSKEEVSNKAVTVTWEKFVEACKEAKDEAEDPSIDEMPIGMNMKPPPKMVINKALYEDKVQSRFRITAESVVKEWQAKFARKSKRRRGGESCC